MQAAHAPTNYDCRMNRSRIVAAGACDKRIDDFEGCRSPTCGTCSSVSHFRPPESLRRFDTDATSSTWALAVKARCRGLLAGDADYEREFSISLDLHGSSLPFERARTELCFGERLRRSRRRSAALGRLDSALDTFTRIGARPWADRARAEILAAGGVGRPVGPVAPADPQELQVALLVGGGSSNREAAAALFLSEKTIEAHLTRIYRSLGVRSRAQLGATLRTIAPA